MVVYFCDEGGNSLNGGSVSSRRRAKSVELTLGASCSLEDKARLFAAGFAPVVRWVDVTNRSDVPLKTVEALTLLDRREKKTGR